MSISGYPVLYSHNVIIMSQVYHIRCQVISYKCQVLSNSMTGDETIDINYCITQYKKTVPIQGIGTNTKNWYRCGRSVQI